MLNIVIAEDELIPRKALIKMLNKDSTLNCNIVADVGTGALVLPYLTQNNIDIVIADIRMPDMDGLELAKHIHNNYPDTDTIVLTAYTNFDYAKCALQYGVKDYLVKPVNEDELHNSIEKLIHNKVNSVEFIKNSIEGGINEFTMENLEFSKIAKIPSLIAKIIDTKNITDHAINIFLCQTQSRQTEEQVSTGKRIITNVLKNGQYELLYFKNEDEYIIINYGRENIGKYEFEIIIREFQEKLGQTIHVGVSKRHYGENLTKLESAYKEAVYAINKRILQQKIQYYEYSKEVQISEIIPKEHEYEIRKAMNDGHMDKVMNYLQTIYNKCVSMDNGIYALYLAIICILRISCEVYRLKSDDISELDEEKYQIFSFKSDLYHIKNKDELFTYILTILNGVSNSDGNEEDDLNIIDDIMNYVNFNYQYDISLNQLATHKYYMNPSYLSRLFKQVTGKNFSKYVIELRMKKAKELLENNNIKVSEIASYVGYNDLSNFIQTFKKYYNITPSQSRHSNE